MTKTIFGRKGKEITFSDKALEEKKKLVKKFVLGMERGSRNLPKINFIDRFSSILIFLFKGEEHSLKTKDGWSFSLEKRKSGLSIMIEGEDMFAEIYCTQSGGQLMASNITIDMFETTIVEDVRSTATEAAMSFFSKIVL